MEFLNVVLDNGVFLILLMIGLIQAAITIIKITGTRNIYITSCVIGLVLMFAYQLCYFGLPATARDWFNVAGFGLLAGVLSPSIYAAGEKLLQKAADKVVSVLEAVISK